MLWFNHMECTGVFNVDYLPIKPGKIYKVLYMVNREKVQKDIKCVTRNSDKISVKVQNRKRENRHFNIRCASKH